VAEQAACAAAELDLPGELTELLSIDLSVPGWHLWTGRTFERELQALTQAALAR
jgi:hypothetical protein